MLANEASEALWIWVESSLFQVERSFLLQEALHASNLIFAIAVIFKRAKKNIVFKDSFKRLLFIH